MYCFDLSELIGIVILSALLTGVIYQFAIRLFKKGRHKR